MSLRPAFSRAPAAAWRRAFTVAALALGMPLVARAIPYSLVSTFPGCADTLQHCVDAAQAGVTIEIATSTPISEVLILPGRSVTLRSAPGFAGTIDGFIYATSGETPATVALEKLRVNGRIRVAPGAADLDFRLSDCIVVSSDTFMPAVGVSSGTTGPFGDLHFAIVGNKISATGDGNSAQCSGITYLGVYDAGTTIGTIEGNDVAVSGCGQGGAIQARTAPDESATLTIDRNRIDAPGSSTGIFLTGNHGGTDVRVAGNLVTGQQNIAGAIGAIVADASGDHESLAVEIVDNTVVGNDTGVRVGARVDLGAGVSGIVANNIVAYNAVHGLAIDSGLASTVANAHNLIFENGSDAFVHGPGTVVADPGFLAGAGYALSATSAAADAGDDALLPAALTVDLDGNPRIAHAHVDLGAFERQGALAVAAPSNLTATALSAHAARLDWSDNAGNEVGYVVEQILAGTFSAVALLPANTTGTDIAGLAAATPVRFRVRARGNEADSNASNEAECTTLADVTPPPPSAPTGLGAATLSTDAIRLDWTDASTDETGFVVELFRDGAFTVIAPAPPNATTAIIDGLAAATAYRFRVRAHGTGGDSKPSNEAAATTASEAETTPPAAPTTLTATREGLGWVRLRWHDLADDETAYLVEERVADGGFHEIAAVAANTVELLVGAGDASHQHGWRVRARNEAGASAYSNLAVLEPEVVHVPCDGAVEAACLGERFAVRLDWRTADGQTGRAHPMQLTADSTAFWFFAPGNLEVALKVLDGCAVNGRYWVFATGLTDVFVRATVTDTWTHAVAQYENPLGRAFQPIQDTGALDSCGTTEPPSTETRAASVAPHPTEAPTGCVDGPGICLLDSRYRVEATWRTKDGAQGTAHGAKLTSDSGTLWFFDAANVELVVKVLDGCAVNDRVWVFAGGLTDVEVTLKVTEIATNAVHDYVRAAGSAFRPIQDTGAFTCN